MQMRLPPELVARLNRFCEESGAKPSRSQAVRTMLDEWLSKYEAAREQISRKRSA
jgi:metal-responsive CopG/Arc/MetJ family transcriptional regulator